MLLKYVNQKGWCLEDLKKIAAPVLGVKYVDISGDGVKELVVLGMKGVHVLQVTRKSFNIKIGYIKYFYKFTVINKIFNQSELCTPDKRFFFV